MIGIEVDNKVAIITIDRPSVLNALDSEHLHALRDAVLRCDARADVGVIVIIGAGDRSFVAGGDIAELSQEMGVADALALPMQSVFEAIATTDKPTIAAVNGFALGGGFELALACDIRLCSSTASFGLPELRWSVLPAAGGVTRLTRLVGGGRALELILTGRRVGADEALAMGIVTRVTPGEGLLASARELATTILSRGPIAVRIARLTVQLASESSTSSSLIAERLGLAVLYGTADKAEGTASFLEKREPRFQGK